MSRWVALAGLLAWALGVAILGTRWEGVEVSPGVWRDSVTLRQWAALWVALVLCAMTVAHRIPRWWPRLVVLVPLLAWIGWSLRGGTLTPLAFAIYATPTVLAWTVALAVSDALRHAWRGRKAER